MLYKVGNLERKVMCNFFFDLYLNGRAKYLCFVICSIADMC